MRYVSFFSLLRVSATHSRFTMLLAIEMARVLRYGIWEGFLSFTADLSNKLISLLSLSYTLKGILSTQYLTPEDLRSDSFL